MIAFLRWISCKLWTHKYILVDKKLSDSVYTDMICERCKKVLLKNLKKRTIKLN